VTKAAAVETLLAETPEPRAVAYLGDDLTDEDAFAALSGRGLAVLARTEPRPTAADWRLDPPAELLDFLERWRRSGRGGPQAPPGQGA
jgi:trehalose-6-phosphatase